MGGSNNTIWSRLLDQFANSTLGLGTAQVPMLARLRINHREIQTPTRAKLFSFESSISSLLADPGLRKDFRHIWSGSLKHDHCILERQLNPDVISPYRNISIELTVWGVLNLAVVQ